MIWVQVATLVVQVAFFVVMIVGGRRIMREARRLEELQTDIARRWDPLPRAAREMRKR